MAHVIDRYYLGELQQKLGSVTLFQSSSHCVCAEIILAYYSILAILPFGTHSNVNSIAVFAGEPHFVLILLKPKGISQWLGGIGWWFTIAVGLNWRTPLRTGASNSDLEMISWADMIKWSCLVNILSITVLKPPHVVQVWTICWITRIIFQHSFLVSHPCLLAIVNSSASHNSFLFKPYNTILHFTFFKRPVFAPQQEPTGRRSIPRRFRFWVEALQRCQSDTQWAGTNILNKKQKKNS